MAKLSLNLSRAAQAWKEVSSGTTQSAGIVLAGDDRLVRLAQQRLASGGTVPATWIGPLAELPELLLGPAEVLVVLIPASVEAEAMEAIGRSAPKAGAVVVVEEDAGAGGRPTQPAPGVVRVSFADTDAGWRQVFTACATAAGTGTVALARRYPAVRAAATQRVITRTAGQNALIGLAFFVPGADMPAMILNQIKMVLSLAGIYGEKVGPDRAVEVAAVVGLGFGMRAFARRLVRLLPGTSLVLKPMIGYAATMALGFGAVRYFEKGAPAATSRVVELVRSLRK